MISVIIPLYNKELSIADTIQTVLKQTFQNFELVIVNDGSTDKSVEMVRTFTDERIRLIEQTNAGPSAARNTGIKAAKGEYIAFLDADDLWEPTCLEEQMRLMQDFPQAGMCGVGYQPIENGVVLPRDSKIENNFRGYLENYFERVLYVFSTCSILIKKEVFDQVGMFDERMMDGEDLDLWWRIILHYPIAYYEKTLVYYKQDAENRITLSLPPLHKHFVYYIEKFAEARKTNLAFRKYYDREVLSHLYKYYLQDRYNPEIQRILRQVDFSILPFSYRLRYKCPRLYTLIKKVRT